MSSIVTNQASDSYLRYEISQLWLAFSKFCNNLLLHNNHLNLILSHHKMSILHPEISVWWPGTVMVYQTLCHICKYLHNVLMLFLSQNTGYGHTNCLNWTALFQVTRGLAVQINVCQSSLRQTRVVVGLPYSGKHCYLYLLLQPFHQIALQLFSYLSAICCGCIPTFLRLPH